MAYVVALRRSLIFNSRIKDRVNSIILSNAITFDNIVDPPKNGHASCMFFQNPRCENCVHFIDDHSDHGKCRLFHKFGWPNSSEETPPDEREKQPNNILSIHLDFMSCLEARKTPNKCGRAAQYYIEK